MESVPPLGPSCSVQRAIRSLISRKSGVAPAALPVAAGGRCSARIGRPRATIAACSMAFLSSRTLPTQGREWSSSNIGFDRWHVGDVRQVGLRQEVLCQGRDVFAAVAQRRDMDREDAQAKVQVFAELAGRHQLGERPVGGGDDPDVGRTRPCVADRRHLAVLDGPQELDLKCRRNVADLVQEHRPAVGQLEQAFSVLARPGERPRRWPKSSPSTRPGLSAARQIGRNGPLRRPLWRWMARATSSLPVPLSPVISTGTSVGATRAMLLNKLLHRRRASDQRFECAGGADSSSPSAARLPSLECPLDHGPGLVQVERLDEVLEGAPLHRPHHGLQIAESRDDNDRRRGRAARETGSGR